MGQFCNLIKRGELWYVSQNNDVSENGHTSIAFWAAVTKLNLPYYKGKLVVCEEGFVACWKKFKILRTQQIYRIFKISYYRKWSHNTSWLSWPSVAMQQRSHILILHMSLLLVSCTNPSQHQGGDSFFLLLSCFFPKTFARSRVCGDAQ